MAQKINVKVAVIGIGVLAFFALGVVFVYMHYNKNPHKLMAKAEQLLETALAETETAVSNNYSEKEIKKVKEIYTEALNNYGGAFGAAKDPQLQIELLFIIVDYHLIDNLVHPVTWNKVAGCWNKILTIDSKNIKANKALLDYNLEIANSLEDVGASPNTNLWKRIQKLAVNLIDAMEEKGQEPDIYVRIVKARGALIVALAGQTTNPEKSANEAMAELQAINEIAPENVEIYKYMAQATGLKAEIDERNGNLEAVEDSVKVQLELLQQAVDVAPENVQAYITILNTKRNNAFADKKEFELLESDYIALTKKFRDQPEAFIALAVYYSMDIDNVDKSIENLHKAVAFDKQNIRSVKHLANAYYRKGIAYNAPAEFEKAAELLVNALTLPDSQKIIGPKETANRMNRMSLLEMLITNYIEIAFAADQADKKVWAAKLSETVHQIEQYFGSEENPQVLKWHGYVDLANGDDDVAIRKLYNAYRQFKASAKIVEGKQLNPDLGHISYLLARLFAEKQEVGLRKQFLEAAITNGIVQISPQILLDYAEIFLDSKYYANVISVANNYKNKYPETPRVNALLVRAYSKAGEYSKAIELLSAMDPDAGETMKLKIQLLKRRILRMATALKGAGFKPITESEQESFTQEEIDKLQREHVTLLKKLLASDPENVESPFSAAAYLMKHKQLEKAKEILDMYIAIEEADGQIDSTLIQAKTFRLRLEEPDPVNASKERLRDIMLDVILEISDPKQKNIFLSAFYDSNQDLEKKYEYLNEAYEIDPDDKQLIVQLFERALAIEDQELIKKYIDIAVEKNVDLHKGKIFKSRLDVVNKDYQNAILKLTECLKSRPTESAIYLLRSQYNSTAGNHQEAINDAKTAMQMNPLDGNIARNFAAVIYARNSQLGDDITKEQRQELVAALRNSIVSNPGVWQLQSIYAELIAEEAPEQALAIRQRLIKHYPNLQTYVQLGKMSLIMAKRQAATDKKNALLQMAEKAFQDAYAIDPGNQEMLNLYSEYYRFTGQSEKAAELFTGSKESMWQFHLRDGQNEKALKILQEQYADDPENTKTLIGLINVSKNMDAKEYLVRYSEELIKVDGNLENKLFQIQMFLAMGLASESEAKLESLKESDPDLDDDRMLLLEAGTIFLSGKSAQAIEIVNEYVQKHPNNTNALKLRSQINRTLGDFDQVVNDLQRCMQLSPSPETQFSLARVHNRLGNKAIAIGILNEALKDGRALPKVRKMLEKLYVETNKKAELANFYWEAIQKYPDSTYWKLQAGVFLSKNKNYDQAERLLLEAWELSKKQGGNQKILSEYLSTLITAKKYQQAQIYATKYIDSKFASMAYAYLGLIQIELKDKEKALEHFYKALEKAGSDTNFIMRILSMMSQYFDQKIVIDWCNSILEKDPASVVANGTMFRLYQRSNNYDKALKYINKCIDSIDEGSKQWKSFSTEKATLLIVAYMKTSEKRYLQQSIVSYEDILEVNPKNTDVMNNLAYLLADNNERIEDAVKYARTAHEASLYDTVRIDTYAYALYRIGDYKKAEELLQSIIAIHEQRNTQVEWDAYKHLAMTKEAFGKKAEAIKYYNLVLELAGNSISAKEKEHIEEELDRLTSN